MESCFDNTGKLCLKKPTIFCPISDGDEKKTYIVSSEKIFPQKIFQDTLKCNFDKTAENFSEKGRKFSLKIRKW